MTTTSPSHLRRVGIHSGGGDMDRGKSTVSPVAQVTAAGGDAHVGGRLVRKG